MADREVFVGMDIGGTKTAVSLFDQYGKVLLDHKEPTVSAKEPEELFEFLCGLVFKCFRKYGISINLLKGIGIGVPSAVNSRTGDILFTPNIPLLTDFNLLYSFTDYFGVRIVVDNDANCAALAEHRFGAGVGCDNMVYVTLSTGIGGGIILNGKLLRGTHGYAGEIGHINIDMNSDDICGCGNFGCAEAIASGANFDKRIRSEIEKGRVTVMNSFPITGEVLKAAYEANDGLAVDIIHTSAEAVGILLYNINCVLDIQRFVIGGGLINFGEAYFEGIRTSFNKYSKIKVDIVPAALGENRGTIGAAQLLFD